MNIVLWLLISTSAWSQMPNLCSTENVVHRDAQLIVQICVQDLEDRLKKSGFICERRRCRGRLSSYSEPVVVMIPKNWSPTSGMHFHFHGHNLSGDQNRENFHFNVRSGDGDYLKFADTARSKSILVFPLSRGHCTTFLEEIKSYDQLNRIAEEVSKATGVSNERWSLSFHSGADKVADRLLADSRIDQKLVGVALFDSLYAKREPLKDALLRLRRNNPEAVLSSYWVSAGTTAANNQWLERKVQGMQFQPVSAATHMGIMSKTMSEFFQQLEVSKVIGADPL